MARWIWFNAYRRGIPWGDRAIARFYWVQKKVDKKSGSDELFTEESFFYVCRQCGLTMDDLDNMNIGQCLDYIQEWIQNNDKENTGGAERKANQSDFNKF